MSDVQALLSQAAQAYAAGNLGAAESLFRKILAAQPDSAPALHGLGMVALSAGHAQAAADLIGRAVARDPRNADISIHLGIALSMSGKVEAAEDAFRAAVSLAPGNADARYNLGLHLMRRSEFAAAAGEFKRVVDKQPNNADALMNLGVALANSSQAEDGLRRLRRCLQIAPAHAEAQFNLANVLYETGDLAAADEAFRAVLAARPDHAPAHYNFANLLRDRGRADDAELHYRRALELDPRGIPARVNLGNMLKLAKRWNDAGEIFASAIAAAPDAPVGYDNLAGLELVAGRAAEAADLYGKALQRGAGPETALRYALVLPVIAQSSEEIAHCRRRMADQIAALAARDIRIDDPMLVGARPFYLAYHGLDDRPLMEGLSALYRRACPSLDYVAPHCAGGAAPSGARIRVGFVSTFFRNHTIGRLYERLIAGLPRDRFEIFVFSFTTTRDETASRIAAGADRFEVLAPDLNAARRTIAEAELDLLYYPDIGMEPLTYFLAHARLAPVQCVSFGHPVTTGISTVDYFVSSELMERADADADYCERLVRLDVPPVSFTALGEVPQPAADGPDFLCAQSLFKFHPEFDPVLGAILERSPGSELVVIAGEHPNWQALLQTRWRRTIPSVADRIRFIPRLDPAGFVRLLASCKVALDTPHFCGGMTSFETFSMGTPLVTMESRYARGRVTLGYYRQMEFEELVARDGEAYAELAVRLARDPVYRGQVSAELRARSTRLVDDPRPVARQAELFAAWCRAAP